jgi:hypothetical protein
LDLIADFNSVEQSFYLVQWLKRITKIHNLLIISVLHLGKKDQNSLGHIGSYLDRKAQSVLKIEKNSQTRTIDLTSQFLRSTDEINPISIQFIGDSWQQVNTEKSESTNIYGMEKSQLLNKIFIDPIEYNDVLSQLSEITGKGQTTCKKVIRDWILKGDIIKSGKFYKRKGGI